MYSNMRYGIISLIDNKVINVILKDPEEAYKPSDNTIIIQSNTVNIGDTYDPVTDTLSNMSLDEMKQIYLTKLTKNRIINEYKGFVYDNNTYFTDLESQVKYLSIFVTAMADNTFSTIFKTKEEFVVLDVTKIIKLTDALKNFITSIYSHEAYLLTLINNANSIQELNNINIETGWPT